MWTTTNLLEAIKERAMLPDNGPLSDSDLLQMATDELHATVMPLVLSVRSDFGVVKQTVDIVAGTAEYRLPHRAIGGKLRTLKRLDSVGNEMPLPIYSPEQTEELANGGCYIEGDYLVLCPTPNENSRMVMRYYVRPGELTIGDDVTGVSGVTEDSLGLIVDYDNPDFAWNTTTLDVYSAQPNFGYKAVEAAIVTSGPGPNQITLAAGTRIALGDRLAESNKSDIPNIPAEAHSWLAQLAACKALEALGDKAGLSEAVKKAVALSEGLVSVLAPRSEGLSATLVNRSVLGV